MKREYWKDRAEFEVVEMFEEREEVGEVEKFERTLVVVSVKARVYYQRIIGGIRIG